MSTSSFSSTVGWSYAMDGGRQVITSFSGLVLAALLGPNAFGVVAMALVYVLFIEMLVKQGMAAAVIQRKDLTPRHLDSAFWLVMFSAVVLMGASAGFSGWWAGVNRTPELQAVIIGLTPIIPLQGTVVVQEALLRRRFQFRALAVRNTVSSVAGGLLGIALALAGFGVWSLVVQQVSTVLIAAVALWAVSDWRPRLRFHRHEARQLLGFSTGSFLSSIGVFVNNRADALLIGLLFGPVVVGLYRMATRLIEMVIGITVRALQSVALADLSRVQDDPAGFRHRVLRLVSWSAVMAIPALGVLAGSSEAVLSLLGEEWLPATNALRLLCLAAVVHGAFAFVGPMLQALGRPHQQALLSWATAALSSAGFLGAGLLFRGASQEVELAGLALSRTMLYLGVFATIFIVLVLRLAKLRMHELFGAIAPAVGAALAAAGVGLVTWEMVDRLGVASWLNSLSTGVSSTLAAVVLVILLDHGAREAAKKVTRVLVSPLRSDASNQRLVPAELSATATANTAVQGSSEIRAGVDGLSGAPPHQDG